MRILEEALTFDDVLLVPAYSEVLPRDVSLASKLTREIQVNLPVVSAAMDTVTEARLAITIAQEGGIGIIHKNMSIDNQARQVDRVKKFESGVISDPISVKPDMTIRQVLELLDAVDLARLIVDGHVLVDDADAAFLRHRDCEASLGHGVHCSGDQWQVDANLAGQLGRQGDIARQHFRVGWHEQDIVKSQCFFK